MTKPWQDRQKKNSGENPKPVFSSRSSSLVICALLALATFLVFAPAIYHDFVNYDDPDYVSSNAHVKAGLTGDGIVWAFTTGHASNWHPLTWISHMMDAQMFGVNPFGHHLVNVLFHIANTLLLFLVLKKMTGAKWRSAFVAALFALHPAHVESVAWISERKDVLSAFFFLLTIWFYARYAKSEIGNRSRKAGAIGNYLLALAFFSLGLMSKPMLVTTPFVLLLLDFWPLQRVSGEEPDKPGLKRLLFEKVPFLALAVASSVVTFIVQRKGGAVTSLESLPVADRIGNALVSYARYLGETFWPVKLAILYPYPRERVGTEIVMRWPVGQIILGVAILLVVTVIVMLLIRRRKYLAVGWFWFLGTLVPVIGLVQVGIQSMADRYTYIPIIGILVAVVWFVSDAMSSARWKPLILGIPAAVILIACGALTGAQIGYWENSETLFRRTVAVTRNNYLAYNNLGFHLANSGKDDEAIINYRKAIEIDPTYEDARNNLGHALAKKGNYAEAIPHYLAALRTKPNHVEVHNNLGNALTSLGKIDEGIEHYKIALTNDAKHADAHSNLGIALAMKGKLDEAIAEFNTALKLKTNNAGAHSNLGNAYASMGRRDEAMKEFQESLRIEPGNTEAQNNLGNVLTELGRADDAVPHYRAAIRIKPDNAEAHHNLGMALVRLGKKDEARAEFAEALRLKPDYAEAQKQLRVLTPP